MKMKSLIKLGAALLIVLPFCLSNSSCGRRVIAMAPQPTYVAPTVVSPVVAQPATVVAPQSQAAPTRKEVRLKRNALRKGVL
ncbi:MAG TPA: hypothetical protein VL022_02755 [Moheibacter sp.]|nr:hypothetical protein [Moheibacter sp.]